MLIPKNIRPDSPVQNFRDPDWVTALTSVVDWVLVRVTWPLPAVGVTTAVWDGIEKTDK